MPCQGLDCHGRPVLFSLIGITGNVGGGNVTEFNQVGVHIGFVAPGIQHQRPQFGTRMDKGLLIHHFSAGGIDENGTRTNLIEEILPRHAAGCLVQRDVQRHNRSLFQEFI